MKPVSFGIIGGGWRSEFYLRIAKELPERFEVCGMVVRNETKRNNMKEKWNIPVYPDIPSMLEKSSPLFAVTSVSWESNPGIIEELVQNGIPVLSETPPAPDLESLNRLYERLGDSKVQVAEQYPFQPFHAARIHISKSGILGAISQVQLSVCHGYHGIALLRKLLGINYENAEIKAYPFTSPIINGPDREGGPQEESIVQSDQVIASLDFGEKLGIYDFTGDQYFSWIRSPRVLVRGDRGEINNKEIRYLKDFRTPVNFDLLRRNAGEDGNLEGYYLKGILAGEAWVYRNPFTPGRLTDDEIAIATCLEKMASFVHGGESFYSLREASQDHYLSIMINEAAKKGAPVYTETQGWARQ